MNLIESEICCIHLEGKPENGSYRGDWVFRPNANQRAAGIRHINPVIMHKHETWKEINPNTGKLEVAINSRTGKPLRGRLHNQWSSIGQV